MPVRSWATMARSLAHIACDPPRHIPLTMRNCLLLACVASLLMTSTSRAEQPASQPESRLNVLFIAIDDLRPQLGSYGHQEMHTPNIDRLAVSGVRFSRHFAQVPTCGASRYAMLTGRRPSEGIDLSNEAFRQMRQGEYEVPESMVDLFRRSGYRTVGIGKISHYPDGRAYGYDRPMNDNLEMPHSWDEMGLPYGKWKHGWNSFFAYADGTNRTDRLKAGQPIPPAESADVPDTGYPDGLIAEAAIAKLAELKDRQEPFFLAVGFFKPHLPFNAPQKYWDLYPEDKVELSPAPHAPENVHPFAIHDGSVEAARYTHPENWRQDEAHHRHLRRGYKAAVSYVDAQVGKVLDALEAQGLADDTIIVLWGDHGWHLGDLAVWGKHTLFDWSLQSPLIIRVPGTQNAGGDAAGVVESLDIYPTLADLCGLETPADLDGQSLRPMLENPSETVKEAAFGYWHPGALSMRTDRYRLSRYQPKDSEVVYELYDLENDPYETRNIAPDHPDLVKQLAAKMTRASAQK